VVADFDVIQVDAGEEVVKAHVAWVGVRVGLGVGMG
jgi:hypothetical protein